ncbi:MAG: universal stress protein [Oscillospiraceae bacterium]|nr:universal stress protein [Oscillospiraceae bacterium]
MRKILLPIDGSKRSLRTVNYVKKIFRPEDCEITVLEVYQDYTYYNTNREYEYDESKLERDMAPIMEELKDYKVETKILFGDPGEKIVKFAREKKFDQIIMTRSSRGPLRMLGSVATYIVRNADFVTVTVIREKDIPN